MRFHEPLLAMRRRGQKPESVFLIVDCADDDAVEWYGRDPGSAHVLIDPQDVPHRLDLRFLADCSVHVLGLDESRLCAVFEAARNAGAARVLSVFAGEVRIHEERHGERAA